MTGKAKNIKVSPQELLQASAAAASKADKAAPPHPGVVPTAAPAQGSAVDAATAVIAAGIATQVAELSAKLAGKGPLIQAATQSGIAHLQARDVGNAEQLREVGQSGETRWV